MNIVDTYREQVLVELEPEKDKLKILVRTELRGEQMSNLCWLVFAAVDSLVKEWYSLEVRTQPAPPSRLPSCEQDDDPSFSCRQRRRLSI
jgi:hypothetical protein